MAREKLGSPCMEAKIELTLLTMMEEVLECYESLDDVAAACNYITESELECMLRNIEAICGFCVPAKGNF
jgi:hypothetical protein